MKAEMTCQLCGGLTFTPVIRVKNANFSSRIEDFSIFRCESCELCTMYPFPSEDDIEELYVQNGVFSVRTENPYKQTWSFQFLEPLYQKFGTDLRFIAKQCLSLAPNSGGKVSVLDVGCSIGRLLNSFRLVRPEIEVSCLTGIDIDPGARKNAIPSLKDRVVTGDLLQYRFEEQFDIISMRYVVEHLLDFKSYIERAVYLLKPGGILFISTPDMDSPQAKRLKDKWNLINDPQQKIGHLRWFNRNSIDFLADTFGLSVEKCINRGEMIYHLPTSVQKLLRIVLGTEPASGRFIRHYTPRMINAIVFDGLLSETLSYGEGLYAFLRKH